MLKTRYSFALLALLFCGALLIAGCQTYVAPDPKEANRPAVTPEEGRAMAQWLRTEWHRKIPLPGGIRLLYADGDTVYVETTYNRLIALNAKTGVDKWLIKTALPLDFPPVSHGDRLYFFAGEKLHVVERETGVLVQSKNPHLGVLVPPVADQETVYVGTATGKTHGISLKDIWPAWTRSLDALPVGMAFMPKNRLFVVTDEGELACINSTNGTFLFRQPLGAKSPVAGPTVSGEIVYIGGRDLYMHALDAGGNHAWKTPVSGVTVQPPVVVDDLLIAILTPAAAVALNARTGELLWRRTGAAHFLTASDKRLYFLDANKQRVLSFDRTNGAPVGAVATQDLFTFCAAPGAGRFAAANKNGELYGFVDIDEVEIE